MEVNAVGTEALDWYIDAWAVHDGRVFASRRHAESIDAETTVFMAVPYLQAIPVGRISTALRATRSGFQDRYRDGTGAEVPFSTLAELRSYVERVYMSAGLGPGAPGAAAGPVPAPAADGGPGAIYLERFAEIEIVDDDGQLPAEPPYGLDRAVRTVAVATVLGWEEQLEDQRPEALRAFAGWLSTLGRCGILDDADEDEDEDARGLVDSTGAVDFGRVARLAIEHDAPKVREACWTLAARMPFAWSYLTDWMHTASWSRGHLVIVPLPRIGRWHRGVRRLVEMHTLALVDRRFRAGGVSTIDLAPLALVSAIRRGTQLGRLPGEPSAAGAGYLAARAGLRWTPAREEAELALERFIDRCLGVAPPTEEPTPTPSDAAKGLEAFRREHERAEEEEAKTAQSAADAPRVRAREVAIEPPQQMGYA